MRTELTLKTNPSKSGASSQAALGGKTSPSRFQGWARASGEVVAKLRDVPFGQRENFVAEEASKRRYSAQYLRRALACYRFAEGLGDGRPELRTQPLSAVEALKRWAEFDLDGALEAADKLIKQEVSSAAIQRMEKAARPGGDDQEKNSALLSKFRSLVLESATEVFPGYRTFKSKLAAISPNIEMINPETRKHKKLAIISVGPFASGAPNARQMQEKIKEALACMPIYDDVVIACSSNDIAESIKSAMDEYDIRSGNLRFWGFPPSDYQIQEAAPGLGEGLLTAN